MKVLADKTNNAAVTAYWPDANGHELSIKTASGLRAFLDIAVASGVTITVEYLCAQPRDLANTTLKAAWKDITASLTNLMTGSAAASYVDTSCLLDISGLFGWIRVKAVYSDASNTTLIVAVTD